jgi:hypothetical protein
MKKLRYYIHSLLYASIAAIAAYTTNENVMIHAHPASLWRVIFSSIIFCLLIAFASFWLTRDHLSAGMIAALAVLGILFTERLFLAVILIVLLAGLSLSLLRRKYDIFDAYVISTILSITITLYYGGRFVIFQLNAPWNRHISMANPIEIESSALMAGYRPDIYYIILDAYGGSEMLEKLHGFDNSEFTSALEERGFVVRLDSKSNYTRTIHSLGASLNMQYLDRVDAIMSDSILWWPIEGTFANNETRKFLESQGYRTISVASGWSFTSMPDADVYTQPYPIFLNEFEEFFMQNTNLALLGFVEKYGVSFPSYDTHRNVILFEFQQLKEIPSYESPKFVFVHIISPHPPFVFDAEGNPTNPGYPFTMADNRYLITPPSAYEKGYLDQLTFLNKRTIEAVDAILEGSPNPPIIIIQGDHGLGNFIDANTLTPPCFYERYSILNAYHLPGVEPESIPQGITPVNTFRMIFNLYFAADLEMLPNRQYFSTPEAVHHFSDVTDRIDDACVFPDN